MTNRRNIMLGIIDSESFVYRKYALAAAFVVVLAASEACSNLDRSGQPTGPQSAGPAAAAARVHQRPKYAPRGVSLPDTGVFTLIPEPPRPDDPEPRPTTEPNVADLPEFAGKTRPPIPPPMTSGATDSWRGWLLVSPGEMRGIYAGFDVVEDPVILPPQSVPAGWVFYAPTALPRGRACLEVTNYHQADPPGAGVDVWNWCSSLNRFQVLNAINVSSWRSKYARTFIDPWLGTHRLEYFVNVYAAQSAGTDGSNDTWRALIYNWNTGAWELLYQVTGVTTRIGPEGWLMHETRNLSGVFDGQSNGICYSLRSTAATDVAFMASDGTWIGPGNFPSGVNFDWSAGGALNCWGAGKPWTFNGWITWGWIAATPSPVP